ncbi:MAG: DNA polymerase III subunit delta [Fusobacteriaceae bacterium]
MLYFIYGDGAPLYLKTDEILEEIGGKNPGISKKTFDCSIGEIESFIESVSQNSMFASKEQLLVKRFERLKHADRERVLKILNSLNLATKEIVFSYEEETDEFGRRVDELGDEKKKKDKLVKGFEKIGVVICQRKENQLKSSIFYASRELNIGEREAEQLIDIVGEEIFKLRNEIEKIKSFLGGRDYSLELVRDILSQSREYKSKKILETMIEKREPKEVLGYLEQEKEYFSVLSGIFEEFLSMYKIKLLEESREISLNMSYNDFKGAPYEKIKERFLNSYSWRPLAAYPIFLKFKFCKFYTLQELEKALKKIGEIEYNHKSGELPIEISLPLFLIETFRK